MPRPQFSLRALLILMAVVGAAIVVYRWPWTETKVVSSETITTQYRRGWTGKALKHGVQRTTSSSPIVQEDWYEDDELRRKRSVQGDIVYNDQSFRGGQLDGPYFDLGSTSTTRGSYRLGKKDGAWQYSGHQVIEDEVRRNGERHGPRTWKTPQGRVLQTTEYEDGRLTHWNEQPFEEEFRRWLMTAIPDVGVQRKMLATLVRPYAGNPNLHYGEQLNFVGKSGELLVVQWDHDLAEKNTRFSAPSIGESILMGALDQSHILSYRYGLLHAVPITPQEVDWHDRTGVYDIRFPPGSAAEQYWLSPDQKHLWRHASLADGFTNLFNPEEDSPVQADLSNVTDLSELRRIVTGPTRLNRVPAFPRIRRDLAGQYLNRAGYRCELRDGKLVILPHLVPPQTRVGPGVDMARPE